MTDDRARRVEQLDAEAGYHRQRVDLYRAVSLARLEEFQRASDAAAARLQRFSCSRTSTE